MTRRFVDQRKQHQLQVFAGEFAPARETIVVAEAAIATAAPKRSAPTVPMPVASNRMPKLVQERPFALPPVPMALMTVNEVVALGVVAGVALVAVPMPIADTCLAGMRMSMTMPVAVARIELGEIAIALEFVKTVTHDYPPRWE